MEFEKKPGARDKKPDKGTRRAKQTHSGQKESLMHRRGGDDSSDIPDTVNLNKNKGWEYVAEAKKEGIVVDVPAGSELLEKRLLPKTSKKKAGKAEEEEKEEEEKEEEEKEEKEGGKTKSKSANRKQAAKEKSRKEQASLDAKAIFVVETELSEKQVGILLFFFSFFFLFDDLQFK